MLVSITSAVAYDVSLRYGVTGVGNGCANIVIATLYKQGLVFVLRRFIVSLVLLAALVPSTASAVVRDQGTASAPVTFSDGAVATAFDHCGDADLCATIDYTNGDKLSIYSEGAAFCQPYMLHFVEIHGSATLYEFTRTLNHDPVTSNGFGVHCGNNQATQMTLDHGLVHLTVDEYKDGSLRFLFAPIKT